MFDYSDSKFYSKCLNSRCRFPWLLLTLISPEENISVDSYLTALDLHTDAFRFLEDLFDVQFHWELVDVLQQKHDQDSSAAGFILSFDFLNLIYERYSCDHQRAASVHTLVKVTNLKQLSVGWSIKLTDSVCFFEKIKMLYKCQPPTNLIITSLFSCHESNREETLVLLRDSENTDHWSLSSLCMWHTGSRRTTDTFYLMIMCWTRS